MKRLIQYTVHSCERVSLFYVYSVLSYSFRIGVQHCFQPVGLQPGGAVLKHEGKFIRQFSAEALLRSLTRRIYCLDLFEALEGTEKLLLDDDLPEIVFQKNVLAEITRYSSTQDEKMKLRWIKGKVRFDELSDELLLLFAAGEKLHIGKNTSFGFGKYIIL